MKYFTRPVEVDIEQWIDLDSPPFGIHDIFYIPGETARGYLPTSEGDKIVKLGDHIVRYNTGDLTSMNIGDIKTKFYREDE